MIDPSPRVRPLVSAPVEAFLRGHESADPNRLTQIRRVLVVEDDPDVAHLVELHLRDLPCEVDVVSDGAAALTFALAAPYDAIILDLTLPRLDGLAFCETIRKLHIYTPVLMLTARSTEADRVAGLEAGADDYLIKPFGIPELLARVKALARRAGDYSARGCATHGLTSSFKALDLAIDSDRRQVSVAGVPVSLTAREFDLLVYFAGHPGRVYTRAQLLDSVWGYTHDGSSHTVNSHINRLRAKIEQDPTAPRFILTVWGVGYKFRDAQDA